MGKKKPHKTKELSGAIAEGSSTRDETQQQQPQVLAQPRTPRKRGRPRKMIEKIDEDQEKNVEPAEAVVVVVEGEKLDIASETKEEEEEEEAAEEKEQPSASTRGRKKEEGRIQERETALRRSRRKISKPIKSI